MVIYLLSFLISCLLMYFAEKLNRASAILTSLFIFLSILIPSVLAGARALTIGTDVITYVSPMYNAASSATSFFSFQNIPILNGIILIPISSFEVGFTSYIYIITKVFGNLFFSLFFIQFICIGLIILGLWSLRGKFPVWLGLSIYYLSLFNPSLNLVRQSIAIAIIIFGFKYLIQNNWVKYVIVVICACLFHKTAIVGLIILLLFYCFLEKKNGKKFFNQNEKLMIVTILVGLIVLVPFTRNIALKIIGLSSYTQGYLSGNESFAINQLILRLPILLFILIQWKQVKNSQLKYFFLSILICDVFTSQLASMSDFASRISLYFSAYYIFIVPYFINDENKIRRTILTIFVISYFLFYWYYSFVIMNYNQTVPYLFSTNLNLK